MVMPKRRTPQTKAKIGTGGTKIVGPGGSVRKEAGNRQMRKATAGRHTHWARDVEGGDVEYAVTPYFARGFVSSIYAPRDTGKTSFGVFIAAQMSQGTWLGKPHQKARTLLNSQEDTLQHSIKPRLEASQAEMGEPDDPHPLIAITTEAWVFPDDLPKLEAKLMEAEAGLAPFDLVILDSVAQHLVRLNSIQPMTEAMVGLVKIARDRNISIIMLGHMTKSKGSTVETAIYGASVLQNMSKGLYVLAAIPQPAKPPQEEEDGEERDAEDEGFPRIVLACERTGWGPKPPSVIFERAAVEVPGYKGTQQALKFIELCDLTSWQVKELSKASVKGSKADEGKTEKASNWIISFLARKGASSYDTGVVVGDMVQQAKADGTWSSANTWDRGRSVAKSMGFTTERVGNVTRAFLAEAPVEEEE
jgi:hypothetical protein